MPNVDPNFNKSWEQISDQRCLDLRKNNFDKPWTVLWSGGIDSTGVMASIVKNLSSADYKNITVACTTMSIWENPQFYFDYIKPNFRTVHSEWANSKEAIDQEGYTFTGNPADQLFGGMGMSPELIFQDPAVLQKNIIKHKDYAIDLISIKTDKKFAEWLCNAMIDNAASAGVEINTLHDMFWWSQFNCAWTAAKLRFLHYGHWQNIKNAKLFLDKFVHWYDNDDYQSWSLHNHSAGQMLDQTAAEYKLAAKKYIYSLDHNRYYRQYKTKTGSSDYFSLERNRSPWCCIDHNWNLLDFENHADQIISMLPDHLAT